MQLKIIACLFILRGIDSTQIGIGENEIIHRDLKTCLSILINILCPRCETIHFVIPVEHAGEANVIIDHFVNSSPMYAMTVYSMDRPESEDFVPRKVGLYLVNTEEDLKIVLKHLREAKFERKYAVLVNFYFGQNFGSYLENTIPESWNSGNALGVAFIALIDGDVQVFGSPIKMSGMSTAKSFEKLSICNDESRIKNSQQYPKIQSKTASRYSSTYGFLLIVFILFK